MKRRALYILLRYTIYIYSYDEHVIREWVAEKLLLKNSVFKILDTNLEEV